MTTIYHNPRCSKSRATLSLLTENGADPTVITYLDSPPDIQTLETIVDKLGCSVRDIMRSGESAYKELELGGKDISDQDLYSAIVDNPILLERPIVVNGGKAAIGRPPENVLEIL